MTTCPGCGGRLHQAWVTTPNYLSCSRCGHVVPNFAPATADEVLEAIRL